MFVNSVIGSRGGKQTSHEERCIYQAHAERRRLSGANNPSVCDESNSEKSSCDSDSASSDAVANDDEAVEPDVMFTRFNRTGALGFGAQYFAIGLMSAGLPGMLYGVFLGYLNVPGYVYSTTKVLVMLPYSFKLFYGALNDTMPIFGMHRVPYMVIGWSLCAVALAKLALTPLPQAYWCVDDAGDYIMHEELPTGHQKKATPCNPDSPNESGQYTFLLMLAVFGYVAANAAADGLMVQYAKLEPIHARGATQSLGYSVRSLGMMAGSMFVGLCMNGKQYNGSFAWSLSFNGVCAGFSAIALAMIPASLFLVHETPSKSPPMSLREYRQKVWDALCGKACFFIVVFNVAYVATGHVSTTAGPMIKKHWAGVQNLQNQLFSMVGSLLFSICLWAVKLYFLNVSWRLMLVVCIVSMQLVDCVFSCFTIFDIVRNQYFYLGETLVTELPYAAQYIVLAFLCAEMSDDGNEGLMYGLFMTTLNMGGPIANALSNQIFRQFRPSLSDDDNYVEDDPSFRWIVLASVMLSYGFSFLRLTLVWLIPGQKLEAQERKRTWPKHIGYGVLTVIFVFGAFTYSMSVNILSMFPSTMCLEYAGGDGCDLPPLSNESNSTD